MGVRMEGGTTEQSGLYAAVVAAMAEADAREPPRKNARKLKTTAGAPDAPQDIAAARRRPGGQPGNGNARKTGYHSAEQKAQRRYLRSLKRRANAAVATVDGFLRRQKAEAEVKAKAKAELAAAPGGREAQP